jgi:hypothetical protein
MKLFKFSKLKVAIYDENTSKTTDEKFFYAESYETLMTELEKRYAEPVSDDWYVFFRVHEIEPEVIS